jgi:hypothetical protein
MRLHFFTRGEKYVSAVLSIVENPLQGDLRDALAARLRVRRLKLQNAVLGSFQNYDLKSRAVLYVGAKTEQPFCMIPTSLLRGLFGDQKLRELPMTITCVKTAGRSIRPILNCGSFDSIAMTYGFDDLASIMDAGYLLERLRF